MSSIKKAFPNVALLFAVILAVTLLFVPGDDAYARGPAKTSERSSDSDARQERSDRGSQAQSRSETRSETRSEARPTTRTESRSEVRSTRSSSSSSSSRDSRSTPAPNVNRSESRTTIRTTTPPARSTTPAQRTTIGRVESRSTDTRGLHRKEYEDLGRIWRERIERRPTTPTARYRPSTSHGYYGVRYVFPGTYQYYAFDYRAGRVFPSLYCYYYGIFPPYVQGYRITYVNRNLQIRYTYFDLPTVILDYDRYYARDYYHPPAYWQYRPLSSALRDLRRAWERSDMNLMTRYVRPGSRVDIFLSGDYAYTVDRQDFHEMTLDAMNVIRTSSFEFYRVRQRSDREAVAYGKHIYYDDYPYSGSGSQRKTVYVSYTLERSGNDWYIVEVGTSPTRLD